MLASWPATGSVRPGPETGPAFVPGKTLDKKTDIVYYDSAAGKTGRQTEAERGEQMTQNIFSPYASETTRAGAMDRLLRVREAWYNACNVAGIDPIRNGLVSFPAEEPHAIEYDARMREYLDYRKVHNV
jgi:hypothetical protein